MAYSLLAHLYPHIRGSQEDIATYSLQYLLVQSKELNRAFTKRISDVLHIDIEDTLINGSNRNLYLSGEEVPVLVGVVNL